MFSLARFVALSASLALLAPCRAAQSPQPVSLEKIEVTAQKRLESIHDVPVTIAAFSGTALERNGIDSYQSLAAHVPGLFVKEQSPNNPAINLRGITSDSLDPRTEPRTSVFLDGVSISRAQGSVVEMFDLARIEVLKGPQGTLFGRSAQIGALSLVQRKPHSGVERSLSLGAGDRGQRHVRGTYNTPLIPDRLLGRVAFSYRRRDGAVANNLDGSELNGRETAAVRGSLRWLATPNTQADLVVNFQRDTPPGTAFVSGSIPPRVGAPAPFGGAAELTRGSTLGVDRTLFGATATLEHTWAGRWRLASVSGWRQFDAYERFDADGSRHFLIEPDDDSTGRQFSHEIRINFDQPRRFHAFAGAHYFRERGRERVPLATDERHLWPFLSGQFRQGLLAAGLPATLVSAAVPVLHPFTPVATLPSSFRAFANPALPSSIRALAALADAPLNALHREEYINTSASDALDLFADGTLHVHRLQLTAGIRHTWERIASGYQVIDSAPPGNLGFLLGATPNNAFRPTAGLRQASRRHEGWAGRLTAKYDFTPRLNAYATLSRGRRPPVLFIDATSVTPLREETVLNREVGLKGRTRNATLSWNAAVYAYQYSNFQSSLADPRSPGRFIAIDAGKATGRGFEFSQQAAIHPRATIFASYGYTDVTFDATGDNGQPQRLAGFTPRLTARHTAAFGSTIVWPSARGHFSLTPVWQYKSRHFFENDNSRYAGALRQDGFALVNLRVAWRSPRSAWEIGLSCNNLLDQEYLIDAGNVGGTYGIPTFIPGTPRLFAANVARHW